MKDFLVSVENSVALDSEAVTVLVERGQLSKNTGLAIRRDRWVILAESKGDRPVVQTCDCREAVCRRVRALGVAEFGPEWMSGPIDSRRMGRG